MHANKHQSLSKLASPFLEVARHIQSTQNRKFVIFLQYFKKKCSKWFCGLLWYKTFIYFTRAQSCSLLLVFVLFLSFWTYKLGKNIVGKFTKLLRIVFHMKCFTADFKNFSRATFKICFFGGWLGTRNQSQVFQGFLWNFLRS